MDFAVFMMTVGREDLLHRALDSIKALSDKIVVVDNSRNSISVPHQVRVVRNPIPWTFSQTQNYFQVEARNLGLDMMIVMHDDAYLVDDTSIVDFARFSQETLLGQPKAGFVHASQDEDFFFSRDHLVAYRMDMIADVGTWDTFLPQYGSDVDWFTRVYRKGWAAVLDEAAHRNLRHDGSSTILANEYFNFKTQILQHHWVSTYLAKKWGEDFTFDHPFGLEENWSKERNNFLGEPLKPVLDEDE